MGDQASQCNSGDACQTDACECSIGQPSSTNPALVDRASQDEIRRTPNKPLLCTIQNKYSYNWAKRQANSDESSASDQTDASHSTTKEQSSIGLVYRASRSK